MPSPALEAYLRHLPRLQAEMQLFLAAAASVPHMDKGERRRALDGWRQEAYGRMLPKVRPLASALAQIGIGTRKNVSKSR